MGARSEGGGLMLGAHNPSASAAVTTTPSSAVNIPVSHDQDDSVFSPSSVDDERMKLIEQVSRPTKLQLVGLLLFLAYIFVPT